MKADLGVRMDVGSTTTPEGQSRMLDHGRRVFGVTGRYEYSPLREALRMSEAHARPTWTLGLAAAVAVILPICWQLLDARMAAALGVGPRAAGSLVIMFIFAAATGLGAVALMVRDVDARHLATAGAASASAALFMTAWAGGVAALILSAALAGIGYGLTVATHVPLVLDRYRPDVRVRMLGMYFAALFLGVVVVLGAIAAALATEGPLTWRSTMLGCAVGGAVVTAACWRSRATTTSDATRVRGVVRDALGDFGPIRSQHVGAELRASIAGGVARILRVPSMPSLLMTSTLSGYLLVPLPGFIPQLWRDRFGTDLVDAVLIMAGAFAVGVAGGLAWLSKRGEILYRHSPAAFLRLGSWGSVTAAVAVAFVTVTGTLLASAAVLAVAVGGLTSSLLVSALGVCVIAPERRRAEAAVLWGLALLGGGIAADQQTFLLQSRLGTPWAIVLLALGMVATCAYSCRAWLTVDRDIGNAVEQLIQEYELDFRTSHGQHVPLLSCRNIDFSYGQLKVLFGVSFAVDDGEMVALLGTNGAGKSTLLRAISGLGTPDCGTVHYRGTNITHLGAHHRVGLGIAQVPGGKAVFGNLSVTDNLRAFGHTHGKDRAALAGGIEASFEVFPRLFERRNQLASTMSGGEQQMLGLAKAFILRPRLLLIDELSLGLAPRVVGELLDMVRRINAAGTAVVLVEQSVNIALSLVEHAYFMEKGEIRFDGKSADLLARPDLLRAVFLQGASQVTG